MTSRRDLGPPLAIAGGIVVVVAIIAGFVAVGGPGAARDDRLDQLTMDKITSMAHAAQCAYNTRGTTFATFAEVQAEAQRAQAASQADSCQRLHYADVTLDKIGNDGDPAKLGEVDYTTIDTRTVRLCGNFRRPHDPFPRFDRAYDSSLYPVLNAERPAGKHCYEIKLVQAGDASN